MNEPSMPLRDIELKTLTIQGKEYKQRKPSFDYRLRELKIRLGHKWNVHYRIFIKDTFGELMEKRESLKKVARAFTPQEIESIFSFDETGERKEFIEKLNKFGAENPDALKDFIETFNIVFADTLTAMELFLINPQNKKDLFSLTLDITDEQLKKINFEPETEEENNELDKAGIEILNFFVQKFMSSTRSLMPLRQNTVSIN